MYFKSRAEAGRQLTKQLAAFANQNIAVVALNEGGVLVGAQIAIAVHANLMLLATTQIDLPREPKPVGGMTTDGTLVYNPEMEAGERDEMLVEYHNLIEQQRMEKFHEL